MALFKDEYQLSGLILDASLTDYRDIAQEVTGHWLLGPFTWLLPTQRDPQFHIADISPSPILMFHCEADPILPSKLGLELYHSAKQPKQPKQWQTSKGGHIQTFNFVEYRQIFLSFLTK